MSAFTSTAASLIFTVISLKLIGLLIPNNSGMFVFQSAVFELALSARWDVCPYRGVSFSSIIFTASQLFLSLSKSFKPILYNNKGQVVCTATVKLSSHFSTSFRLRILE